MAYTLILTESDAFYHTLASSLQVASLGPLRQATSLPPRTHAPQPDLTLLDAALTASEPTLLLALKSWCRAHPSQVVVVFEPDPGRHLLWLRAGALRVFGALEACEVTHACQEIALWMTRHSTWAQGHLDSRHLRRELLALNAMVQALAGTLDQEMILSRALRHLVSACKKGALAYLCLERPPPPPSMHQGLFTESEAQELEEPASPPPHTLRVLHQLAADRLPVCHEPTLNASWRALLGQRAPKVIRQGNKLARFPGLEPLGQRIKGGVTCLIPIHGREGAIGVLVMAELGPSGQRAVPFESESLWSIASLLGGALETARMFDELHHAYGTLQQAQEQFVQSEKFAAVGLLAAQIAHEINNPSSFVISNMSVMQEYMRSLETFMTQVTTAAPAAFALKLAGLKEVHEVEFLGQDIQDLLERSLHGMHRIHQIVHDLRYLAHDSGPEHAWVDLESLLDAAINIVRAEVRTYAAVHTQYAKLAPVFSDGNKLSQVFLNILVNASHALRRKAHPGEDDYIQVTTKRHQPGYVLVCIEDTGQGISPEHLSAVFEPFFTTKPRGVGTGLGLSLSRDMLRSLGGDVRVFSELGQGTTFEIMLPTHSSPSRRPQTHTPGSRPSPEGAQGVELEGGGGVPGAD